MYGYILYMINESLTSCIVLFRVSVVPVMHLVLWEHWKELGLLLKES